MKSVVFASDNSIGIGLCAAVSTVNAPSDCALSLVRWRDGELRPIAHAKIESLGLHAVNDDRIIAGYRLFSADLSSSIPLPSGWIARISPSGTVIAQGTKTGFRLYRVGATLEQIREVRGTLEALSDQIVITREGDILRTETIEGKVLGSFPLMSNKRCLRDLYLIPGDKLLVTECERTRAFDFNGIEQHVPVPSYLFTDYKSQDGKRALLHIGSRKVSKLRTFGKDLRAITTLGMGAGDEENNRDEVKVIDTSTGKTCFDWRYRYPMGSESLSDTAAISPSGDWVAIEAGTTLSLYSVPKNCEQQ